MTVLFSATKMDNSTRRLTLSQENNSCHSYYNNDEKLCCSKDVLHITGQFDAITVDRDDDHCRK